MPTDQRKAGIRVVIERCCFPARWRMAAGTICSTRAIVHILLRMAGNALCGRPCPALPGMAGQAGCRPVAAGQCIARRPVIERERPPAVHIVTGLAVLSEATQMRVFLRVAGCAGCRDSPEMGTIAMTSRTAGLGVAAEQGIVSQLVVEAGAREPHHRKGATVMLAVADLAGL